MVGEFTDRLEADDWKDAAAVVGLIRFLTMPRFPIIKKKLPRQEKPMMMIPNTTKDWMYSNLTQRISRMRNCMRLLRTISRKNCIIVQLRGRYIKRNGQKRKLTLSMAS